MAKLSSAKELGKPENPYSRKRKKLLSLTSRWEVGECDRSGGSKKRHANSSSRIEGALWASPLVKETDRNSFPSTQTDPKTDSFEKWGTLSA
ncbi:hypothetical protein IEQ34_019417 [Dendrobium chrysotoxum]|uniref:Uncharacterized protein n=1 Tax=Dendrobium chrysotoxum TaxID=161865 RepID=A0AAV7G9W5_DENCH|nr:hypothetical protein IEQ34_019417 [Dendrobium chrysotoxum]